MASITAHGDQELGRMLVERICYRKVKMYYLLTKHGRVLARTLKSGGWSEVRRMNAVPRTGIDQQTWEGLLRHAATMRGFKVLEVIPNGKYKFDD